MRTDHRNDQSGRQRGAEQRGPARRRTLLLAIAALLVVLVVGVARRPQLADETPAVRARGGVAATAAAVRADTITPAMLALGERVFQGKEGGALCTSCHGKDAKGMKGLGPDLTDGVWLHGDGSLAFLKTIIRTGVMQPRQSGSIMPPYGGTPLPPDRLEAVAAYVYSLGHREGSASDGRGARRGPNARSGPRAGAPRSEDEHRHRRGEHRAGREQHHPPRGA